MANISKEDLNIISHLICELKKMLKLQRDYFQTRDKTILSAAKTKEGVVDALADATETTLKKYSLNE